MEAGPPYVATLQSHRMMRGLGRELGPGESSEEPWQPQGGTASPWALLDRLGPTK